MPIAGDYLDPTRYSGARIATAVVTANSANVTTTETTVMSVTAALVSGRIYRVTAVANLFTSQASVRTDVRIREGSATGTVVQTTTTTAHADATKIHFVRLEAEYTAVSTGNKTFVFTIVQASGTGNHTMFGSATIPDYLYVDYIRG